MKAGITVQARIPGFSVAWQAQIDIEEGSDRKLQKVLTSEQQWTWVLGLIDIDDIAVLCVQSVYELDVTINGTTTTIFGQKDRDLGILFCTNGVSTLGELPFVGDLEEIVLENKSTKPNRVDIVIAKALPPESGS